MRKQKRELFLKRAKQKLAEGVDIETIAKEGKDLPFGSQRIDIDGHEGTSQYRRLMKRGLPA